MRSDAKSTLGLRCMKSSIDSTTISTKSVLLCEMRKESKWYQNESYFCPIAFVQNTMSHIRVSCRFQCVSYCIGAGVPPTGHGLMSNRNPTPPRRRAFEKAFRFCLHFCFCRVRVWRRLVLDRRRDRRRLPPSLVNRLTNAFSEAVGVSRKVWFASAAKPAGTSGWQALLRESTVAVAEHVDVIAIGSLFVY